ncbi:MAG: hypothetical protein ABW048_05565 [Sphingobium sp.]
MYDYLDRSVGSLDEGSRFLVWSMRGWTQSMAKRRCPLSVLGSGYTRCDLDAMLPHLHLAMMTLNRDGLDRLGFGAMGCPQVSEAEAILLATVGLYARGRVEQGHATVALLVQEGATVVLRQALAVIALSISARFPLDRFGSAVDSAPTNSIKNRIDRGVDGE